MIRLLAVSILLVGLAACGSAATEPGQRSFTNSASSTPTNAVQSASIQPTVEASIEPSVQPSVALTELVAALADLPSGFAARPDEEISIASEVESYGPDRGPARAAALTERGFKGGLRRILSSGEVTIASEVWSFETAEGARAEFDELSGLYLVACPQLTPDIAIGDASAEWVCPAGPGAPREQSSVAVVQGSNLLYVSHRGDGAAALTAQILIAGIAQALVDRLP